MSQKNKDGKKPSSEEFKKLVEEGKVVCELPKINKNSNWSGKKGGIMNLL